MCASVPVRPVSPPHRRHLVTSSSAPLPQQEHPLRSHEQPGDPEGRGVPCLREEPLPDAPACAHEERNPRPAPGAEVESDAHSPSRPVSMVNAPDCAERRRVVRNREPPTRKGSVRRARGSWPTARATTARSPRGPSAPRRAPHARASGLAPRRQPVRAEAAKGPCAFFFSSAARAQTFLSPRRACPQGT